MALDISYSLGYAILKPQILRDASSIETRPCYDRNMQIPLYANLPRCHQPSQQFVIWDINFSDPLLNFRKKEKKAASFLYKFVTFCHWRSRKFLICKGKSGEPTCFISYSVKIRAELCPSIHFG